MSFLAPLLVAGGTAVAGTAAAVGTAAATTAALSTTQLVLAGASAAGTVMSGMAQRQQYKMQAEQAQLRGRSEAIAYKQKGADALRNLNETLAAVISRSASGGVDPTSGSSAVLQQYALSEGVREHQIAQDNGILALGQASAQAGIYQSAGRSAMMSSLVSAGGAVGQGIYRYGQLQ